MARVNIERIGICHWEGKLGSDFSETVSNQMEYFCYRLHTFRLVP
jgi:hypothetical protein